MPSAAHELLAARAARIRIIRRRAIASTVAAFALAWGVVAFNGSMGETTATAQTTTTNESTDTATESTESTESTADTTTSSDDTYSDDSSTLSTAQS